MISRFQKMRLLCYYSKEVCKCGRSKKAYRWMCLNCRDKIKDTEGWKLLDKACQEHLYQAQNVVDLIENR